jgi:hypothetical protein
MAAGWSPEGSKSETTSNLPVSGVLLGYGAAPWLASAGVVAGLLALLACARLRETRQHW